MFEPDGILSAIGNTPLVPLKKIFASAPFRLYGKLEYLNPGGSAKDRPALYMIRRAMREGRIHSDTVLVESSSGNLAISLAQICSYLGLPLICVVDPKTTEQNIRIMKAFGARVERVEEPDPDTGEYLVARLQRVRQLVAEYPDALWLNQYDNPGNAQAHYETTVRELFGALDRIDYLFCGISSCGTIRGCADYIRDCGLPTKVVAVDSIASNITEPGTGTRLIPGLGAGVRPSLYCSSGIDKIVRVSDADCVAGCRKLLRTESILAGGSSGGIVAAMEAVRHEIPSGAICAAIFPDRGERYLDTIYSDRWVAEHLPETAGKTCFI